jgi:hypothetical protein
VSPSSARLNVPCSTTACRENQRRLRVAGKGLHVLIARRLEYVDIKVGWIASSHERPRDEVGGQAVAALRLTPFVGALTSSNIGTPERAELRSPGEQTCRSRGSPGIDRERLESRTSTVPGASGAKLNPCLPATRPMTASLPASEGTFRRFSQESRGLPRSVRHRQRAGRPVGAGQAHGAWEGVSTDAHSWLRTKVCSPAASTTTVRHPAGSSPWSRRIYARWIAARSVLRCLADAS